MYAIRSARDERSSPCVFRSVFYACKPARAIKTSWLAKHAWCLSDKLIDMERWGRFEYAKQTKLCMRIHTQQDLAESSQFAFRLMHAKSTFNLSV